jgi:hypothetical protein
MRMFLAAMPLMTLLGCATVQPAAVCDATAGDRTALAAALVADGGPHSMAAGRTLISRLDAGCNDQP